MNHFLIESGSDCFRFALANDSYVLIRFMSSLEIFLPQPVRLSLDGAGKILGLVWSCTACLAWLFLLTL